MTNFLKIIFIITILPKGNVIALESFIFDCKVVEKSRCVIEKIEVTSQEIVFRAPNPMDITAIDIDDSNLEELPSLCNRFPNLSTLYLYKNNIKYIRPFTFENCTKVETIELRSNKIKTLDENVFNGLDSLQHLYFDDNDLFYVSEKAFLGLKKLSLLTLDYNRIFDIEADEILKNSPGLEKISINDNFLRCSTIKKIVDNFTLKGVQFLFSNSGLQQLRNRRDNFSRDPDSYCLNDSQWTKALRSEATSLNLTHEGFLMLNKYLDEIQQKDIVLESASLTLTTNTENVLCKSKEVNFTPYMWLFIGFTVVSTVLLVSQGGMCLIKLCRKSKKSPNQGYQTTINDYESVYLQPLPPYSCEPTRPPPPARNHLNSLKNNNG